MIISKFANNMRLVTLIQARKKQIRCDLIKLKSRVSKGYNLQEI